jgi:hypothetical protein
MHFLMLGWCNNTEGVFVWQRALTKLSYLLAKPELSATTTTMMQPRQQLATRWGQWQQRQYTTTKVISVFPTQATTNTRCIPSAHLHAFALALPVPDPAWGLAGPEDDVS